MRTGNDKKRILKKWTKLCVVWGKSEICFGFCFGFLIKKANPWYILGSVQVLVRGPAQERETVSEVFARKKFVPTLIQWHLKEERISHMIELDWLPWSIRLIWDSRLFYMLPERCDFSTAALLKPGATFPDRREIRISCHWLFAFEINSANQAKYDSNWWNTALLFGHPVCLGWGDFWVNLKGFW